MSILDLPDEILEMIASYLDPVSLLSFRGKNTRLRQLFISSMKYVKLTRESRSVERYLVKYGHAVQTLDLSNGKWLPLPVSVIGLCSNVTHLDIVNTRVRHDDLAEILYRLPKLESLDFSLTTVDGWQKELLYNHCPLKKFYVEVRSHPDFFRMVIDFMNKLDKLEDVHVNVIGAATLLRHLHLPNLDAERLMKLNTFVCSCHLAEARSGNISVFLKKIFAENLTQEVKDWIEREKDCYIYERGFFNSDDTVGSGLADKRFKLLGDFYVLDLAARNHDERLMESPWGRPRSLRVQYYKKSRSLDFSRLFTSVLVELDITGYHGVFSAEFWRDLVKSSPSLENLAVPICSFQFPRKDSDEIREQEGPSGSSGDTPNPRDDIIEQSLQKLYLKKLFIKGNLRSRYAHLCPACSAPLDASYIPDMKSLDRLQELTFNNVAANPSALRKMANPFARTVRLHLNCIHEFCDIRAFIQGCRNLTDLKLSGLDTYMPFYLTKIFDALSGRKKLKQLCLGSAYTFDYGDVGYILSRIPRSVRVMHIHANIRDADVAAISDAQRFPDDRSRRASRSRFRFESKIFSREKLPSIGGFRASNLSEPFLGRSLCHPESFAGFVKPMQWEVRGD